MRWGSCITSGMAGSCTSWEECHHYLLAVAELATQLGGALEVTSELEDRVSDLQRQNDSLRR